MNDKPIIITDSYEKSNTYKVYRFDNIKLIDVKKILELPSCKGVCLVSDQLEIDWAKFILNFKVIEAAGGKVVNSQKEVLFIYRFDKWDLPKGHIEIGENKDIAAIREVEEECGISRLSIKEELPTTYHVFSYKSELRLKITYWFLMHSDFTGDLVPQIEEGITETVFKNEIETKVALKNTYANIKLLF